MNAPKGWQHDALCADLGIDPELFFRADTWAPLRNQLRGVCGMCPVRRICLESNLTVPHGMYGGLTWRERRKVLQKRGYWFDRYGRMHGKGEVPRTARYPERYRVVNGKVTR